MSTRDKILNSALQLFNSKGLVNVRLQHIADASGISVGNLAYHLHNKEAIVVALYEHLAMQQKQLLTKYRLIPLFENINHIIYETFHIQQTHIFFYSDILEIIRAYPQIGTLHQKHIASQIDLIKIMLDFNVSRGAFKRSIQKEKYDILADQIWMTMDLWVIKQNLRKVNTSNFEDYHKAIWNLLTPYFTEMGIAEHYQLIHNPFKHDF